MSKASGLATALAFWGQAWALPIGGGEPPDPPTHSGPIIPAPTNLTVRARSESQVIIDFQCGGNADAHEGWRRLPIKGSFARTSYASGCSFKDATVLPETNYCYKVRALNETNEAWSPILCVTTPAPTSPPAAPTVWLDTFALDSIKVVFRDNSTNENYFRAYRRRVGESTWSIVHTVTRTGAHRSTGEEISFFDLGLLQETEYEYIVQAGYDPIDPTLPTLRSNSVAVVEPTRVLNFGADGGCIDGTEGVCDATFALSNGTQLTYYRNFPINTPNANITRLVVVVHGKYRNAWLAFDAMASSANSWGVIDETLIVAPEFRESQWGNWVQGDQSYAVWPGWMPTISSYAAVDELVTSIVDSTRFPGLQEVVIAGHSGGGQFAQRYAATSRIEDSHSGLRFRYVVANPNSYMYLNPWRRSATGSFVIPTTCPGYNDYKFGLENRNAYASQVTDSEILAQYPGREVIYLLGDADTDVTDENLGDGCAYSLQGPQRLSRGTNYYEHILKYFPGNYHRRLIVPGAGHDPFDMYFSMEGVFALFF
jgi:pimeloyl-ACP methyl ester carboxylesterase